MQISNEYKARINKAFDYIESKIEHPFTLEELAGVANFSKFHFHRIFHALVGETPFQFIQRVRLEKAASLLSSTNQPISEIASLCGYTDISVFSRNFKTYFKQSATNWRKNKNSNLSQEHSNIKQSFDNSSIYFCSDNNTLKWRTDMSINKSVEVKDLPKMTVAYIRHIGPYAGDEKLFGKLWNKIFSWAGPRGLINRPDFMALIVYHDDPKITKEEKLRTSVCITIPPQTKVDGEIGKMEMEGGKYVMARFDINAQQFPQAWDWVYGQWLPESGYQPDDKPCFEIYAEEPKNGRFLVDICVPIKPL